MSQLPRPEGLNFSEDRGDRQEVRKTLAVLRDHGYAIPEEEDIAIRTETFPSLDMVAKIAYAQKAAVAVYAQCSEAVADDIAQTLRSVLDGLALHDRLVSALRMAYLKHHCDDARIGWEELDDILFTVLTEAMGDSAFQAWLAQQEKDATP